jgi:hypothetical protein
MILTRETKRPKADYLHTLNFGGIGADAARQLEENGIKSPSAAKVIARGASGADMKRQAERAKVFLTKAAEYNAWIAELSNGTSWGGALDNNKYDKFVEFLQLTEKYLNGMGKDDAFSDEYAEVLGPLMHIRSKISRLLKARQADTEKTEERLAKKRADSAKYRESTAEYEKKEKIRRAARKAELKAAAEKKKRQERESKNKER